MKYALVLLLFAVPAQEFEAAKERERNAALERRVTELERTVVRGEDMWIEFAPGKFICRIPGGDTTLDRIAGRPGGCSEHWRVPVSGRR